MCQRMSNRGRWRVETRIADMVGDGDVIMISVWSKAWGFETAQIHKQRRKERSRHTMHFKWQERSRRTFHFTS